MKDTKQVVVCLLKNHEGKFLMLLPSDKKNYGQYQDAWCFPSGHIKENETQVSALEREISEELGINVTPKKLISEWAQDVPGETAFWWECESSEANISPNPDEVKTVQWFYPEEIKSLKIWPAMTKFLTEFVWEKS